LKNQQIDVKQFKVDIHNISTDHR